MLAAELASEIPTLVIGWITVIREQVLKGSDSVHEGTPAQSIVKLADEACPSRTFAPGVERLRVRFGTTRPTGGSSVIRRSTPRS
jgi:hypothetical protein